MRLAEISTTLVVGAQRGDRAAADKLARELRPHLIRFHKKRYSDPDRVEDAVQDTLDRVVQNLASLKDPSAIRAWTFQIAKQTYVDSAGCPVHFERKPPPDSPALLEEQFSGHELPRFKAKTLSVVAWQALDQDERASIPDPSPPTETRYVDHIDPADQIRALCHNRGHAGKVFLAVHELGLSHKEAQLRFHLKSEGDSRTLCFRCKTWLKPQLETYLGYASAGAT